MNDSAIDPSLFPPDDVDWPDFQEIARRQFDYVIVGGGCIGTALASFLRECQHDARILVLEQGPFLIRDHLQNLPSAHQSLMDTSMASPWRATGDLTLAAQVPYLGGRASLWSGWTPQPRPDHLRDWPAQVVSDLAAEWAGARAFLGVRPASDLGTHVGTLHSQARHAVFKAIPRLPLLEAVATEEALDAPLSTAVAPAGPGVARFSPVPVLLELMRGDGPVVVLAECEVRHIEQENGHAEILHTSQGRLPLNGATLVLANGTMESTTLVLRSFPAVKRRHAGRNLNGHVGSWFACRVPRSRFPGLPTTYQVGAIYVNAGPRDRHFHLQLIVSATTDPARDAEEIYRLIPDLSGADVMAQLRCPEHVVAQIRGVGEVSVADRLSSSYAVEIGDDDVPGVQIELDEASWGMWDLMDGTLDALTVELFGASRIEYWSSAEQRWVDRMPAERRQPLLMHEAGTLWMGSDPTSSVTDLRGRLHGCDNLYVATAAAFPTTGSWNPTLTMVAMARRLARHLTDPSKGQDGS